MKIQNKVVKSELISWQELKTYEFNQLKDNSNRDITKLKNSIINQGFSFALCNWFEHRYIIDGTGRYLALLELEKEGYDIPDLLVNQIQAENIKEAKKLALMVSSKHGEITQTSLADFTNQDFEMEELKDLALEELNLGELDFLVENLETEVIPPEDPNEEVFELKKEPFVVKGDIFEIKLENCKYRIGCLDSRNVDDLKLLFGESVIDLVFTDPPYGVDITKSKKSSPSGVLGLLPEIAGDTDTNTAREFYNTCQSLKIPNYIIWGGNYFTDFLPPSRCWFIWDKNVPIDFSFAGGELAWCSMDKNTKIFKQDWSGNLYGKIDLNTEGLEKEDINQSSRVNRVHPTQKPVELQKTILNWLDPNNQIKNIFDGFVGGGSLLLVGIQTKRNVFASELTEYYTQVSVKRCVDYLTKNNIKFQILLNNNKFDISKLD